MPPLARLDLDAVAPSKNPKLNGTANCGARMALWSALHSGDTDNSTGKAAAPPNRGADPCAPGAIRYGDTVLGTGPRCQSAYLSKFMAEQLLPSAVAASHWPSAAYLPERGPSKPKRTSA